MLEIEIFSTYVDTGGTGVMKNWAGVYFSFALIFLHEAFIGTKRRKAQAESLQAKHVHTTLVQAVSELLLHTKLGWVLNSEL
jgi:hypothetical protein